MAPSIELAQNCVKPSIDYFPHNHFMTHGQRNSYGLAIVYFIIAVYLSGAIAVLCENYFLPAVKRIAAKLKVSSDIAGATIIAVGCSAPQLFTSVIGVFIKSDIGLGSIVGSAVFNVLLIVAICSLFAGSTLRLSRWPMLRHNLYFLLSIAALAAITYDRKVYWYEALVLVFMYVLYILLMYFNTRLEAIFQRWLQNKERFTDIETELTVSETSKLLPKQNEKDDDPCLDNSICETQVIHENNDSSVSVNNDPPISLPRKVMLRSLKMIMLPFKCLFYLTIPDCRKNIWEKWYLVTFIVSVMWTGLLCYVLVWIVSIIGFTLGIPDVIAGLTLLAAGGGVPDAISSLLVARQGDGDMAVSNAIGGNMFDILICLGLPWLLKTTILDLGGYVEVVNGGIVFTSMSLFGTGIVALVVIALNKWCLNKCLGVMYLLLYVVFTAIAILLDTNILGNLNKPTCRT